MREAKAAEATGLGRGGGDEGGGGFDRLHPIGGKTLRRVLGCLSGCSFLASHNSAEGVPQASRKGTLLASGHLPTTVVEVSPNVLVTMTFSFASKRLP